MQCLRVTTYDLEQESRRTMFPHLKINFNVFVEERFLNYRRDPRSTTGLELIQGLPTSDIDTAFASESITVKQSLSYDAVREAVKRAAAGTRLLPYEQKRVVKRACEEVRRRYPTGETLPKYTVLYLDFDISVKHSHVYAGVADYDYPRMIPAADSALGMLEKYEVGSVNEAEKCCCICLEDLSGGEAAVRMPCKHVYHDGCIKEWLRTSHYCPLCRYQMPTQ